MSNADSTPSNLRWSGAFQAVSGFAAGEVVADRFRITRFIASGGMGEVYEAEDLELKERVALKTIRPELTEDGEAVERFRREIQLARRVTHSSVCRSFDLFRHRLAPPGWQGPPPEVVFLSMELLEGETLSQRIKRAGPLKAHEALPIVQQVAAALGAAHDAGIVHRDLKTSNIVLVPPPRPGAPVRAVVTDFGLARASDTGSLSASSTGGLAGSPAYMAPEQVQGGRVSPATDVYSLGVVLYEMVTGRWPFAGDSPLTTALMRLSARPTPPRELAPDLDPAWEHAILRCLERDPADRFGSTAELVAAVTREGSVTAPRRTRRRQMLLAGVGLACAILVGLNAAFLYWTRSSPAARQSGRRSVAVLGFKNLTGRAQTAWLAGALPEMVRAELSAGEELLVIPGESVARMKRDLSLPDEDSLAPETLAKVRANLGSDLVVLGTYFASGDGEADKVRLDVRVQQAQDGATVASISDTGTGTELLDLVSRAGAELRQKLGVAAPSALSPGGAKSAIPARTGAARLYAEGLQKLRAFDALGARDGLEAAVAADPQSPLAHAALAAAWSALGFDQKAAEAAKRAFDLSANLSREDRLVVEGRHHEAAKEWPKAIDVYRTLWGFFLDNVEYGLRLAEAQTSGGKGRDALTTLQALRKLPVPVSDDPRIDLAEASAAESLADYKLCQARAARAAEKARPLGARLLVAQARFQEGRALMRVSDYPGALAAAEEAKKTFAAVGDRSGVARSTNLAGIVEFQKGDLDQAKRTWEETLAIAREIGDRDVAARALNNIGNLLRGRGDPSAARTLYEQSLEVWREIGRREGVAITLGNIAELQVWQGDLPAAKKAADEALALARETGDRSTSALATAYLGARLRQQGDLAGATRLYEDALAIQREIGDRLFAAESLSALGSLLTAQGELALARTRHEEALALRSESGERGGIASSRRDLARLDLEEGQTERAETALREALREFRSQKAPDPQASTLEVLARCLAQEKPREALDAIRGARALPSQGLSLETRLSVAITAARVQVVHGEAALAIKTLEGVLREASRAGFVPLQFEARLARAEIELRFGIAASGKAQLAALEKDAAAKGFGLIARKAGELRK